MISPLTLAHALLARTRKAAHPERSVVRWLAGAGFVVAVNAVVIFPLGPFLVAEMRLAPETVGYLGGIHGLAAALGSLLGAAAVDRYERRMALAWCAGGFILGTAASAASPDIRWLFVTRGATGLFAGPLWGLLIAAVADVSPESRRGAAVGAIVGAYGLALVLGLPAGTLLAAGAGGWRLAFLLLAVSGGVLCLAAVIAFARFGASATQTAKASSEADPGRSSFLALIGRGTSAVAFLLVAATSFAALLVSPVLPLYALRNGGMAPAALSAAYLLGGLLSLTLVPATGRLLDRVGALVTAVAVAALNTVLLLAAFTSATPAAPLLPLLSMIMVAQLMRSTVSQAATTRVPGRNERGAFQALASCVTYLAQGLGAMTGSALLSEGRDGRLLGVDRIALIAVAITWTLPALLAGLEALMRRNLPLSGSTL